MNKKLLLLSIILIGVVHFLPSQNIGLNNIIMKFKSTVSPVYNQRGIVTTGIARIDSLNEAYNCDRYHLIDYIC